MKQTTTHMKHALHKMTQTSFEVFERCRSVFYQTFYATYWRQENALIPLIISPKRPAYRPEYRPDLYELEP